MMSSVQRIILVNNLRLLREMLDIIFLRLSIYKW